MVHRLLFCLGKSIRDLVTRHDSSLLWAFERALASNGVRRGIQRFGLDAEGLDKLRFDLECL